MHACLHLPVRVKFHRMHEMLSQGYLSTAKISGLHGMPSFYVGMPILTVRMGKILLFTRGAYFHSGMPIFTVKMGTRMPTFT